MEDLLARMDHLKAWDYERKIKQILSKLKISDFDQRVSQLSGGQVKRVALANVLITEPDLLILDEPTNHLDLEMIEWLENYLSRSTMSILMVTHDRYFLDRICSSIIEMDDEQLYFYTGNYSYYLDKRQDIWNPMAPYPLCLPSDNHLHLCFGTTVSCYLRRSSKMTTAAEPRSSRMRAMELARETSLPV
jgi:energy-coupling factor transporter ATP-binding protein EcfA2